MSRNHHIDVLDPQASPAITVESGAELRVETWDAFDGEVGIPDMPYLLYK